MLILLMAPLDPARPPPTVAIITVSYRSDQVLPAFLASIAAASTSPPFTVIADNSPSESDSVRSAAAAAGAEYIPLSRNRGYGGAINAAAATLPAPIEWIIVSNPDVVLHPFSVDRMIARLKTDPSIATTGPAVYTASGDIYPSARAIPSLRTGIGHALFANLWVDNPWTREYRNDYPRELTVRDTGWLSGACLAIRRTAFDEIGGFDEAYFMYFEDVDLGHRMTRAGYRNVYEPHASVTHSGAHSTSTDSPRMISIHHRSAQRFLALKYPGPVLWPVRFALELGLTVRSWIERRRLGK